MIVIPKQDQFKDFFMFTLNPGSRYPVQFNIKRDFSDLNTYSVMNVLNIAKISGVPSYQELPYFELIEAIKANVTFE
jgi:hypothetical protein